MAGVKPGPVCTIRDGIDFIDSGTLTRWRSEEPAPVGAGSLSSLSPMLTNVAAKSAPAGIDLTRLGVTDQSIREHDNQFTGRIGGRFKQLVETAAAKVDINPGLLAAVLLAETVRANYLKHGPGKKWILLRLAWTTFGIERNGSG